MSDEQLPKGRTLEAGPTDGKEPPAAPQPQAVSIQDILNTYPIDREKCRDVLIVEMSKSLMRIADSLEGITQGLIVVNTHLSKMNALKNPPE